MSVFVQFYQENPSYTFKNFDLKRSARAEDLEKNISASGEGGRKFYLLVTFDQNELMHYHQYNNPNTYHLIH